MKLELIQDKYEPCTTKIFTINGIDADPDDFGEVTKHVGHFCCEYREFSGFEEPPTDVLEKYHITKEEFFEVCDELRDMLTITDCGRCL